jgi:hypothetical protein
MEEVYRGAVQSQVNFLTQLERRARKRKAEAKKTPAGRADPRDSMTGVTFSSFGPMTSNVNSGPAISVIRCVHDSSSPSCQPVEPLLLRDSSAFDERSGDMPTEFAVDDVLPDGLAVGGHGVAVTNSRGT